MKKKKLKLSNELTLFDHLSGFQIINKSAKLNSTKIKNKKKSFFSEIKRKNKQKIKKNVTIDY